MNRSVKRFPKDKFCKALECVLTVLGFLNNYLKSSSKTAPFIFFRDLHVVRVRALTTNLHMLVSMGEDGCKM